MVTNSGEEKNRAGSIKRRAVARPDVGLRGPASSRACGNAEQWSAGMSALRGRPMPCRVVHCPQFPLSRKNCWGPVVVFVYGLVAPAMLVNGPVTAGAVCKFNPAVVQLGPLCQELDASLVTKFPRSLVGVTPQGWMRGWSGPSCTRCCPGVGSLDGTRGGSPSGKLICCGAGVSLVASCAGQLNRWSARACRNRKWDIGAM